jgi:hypothetical protein
LVITLAGRFTLTGLEATVNVEQTEPTACTYAVQWVGTKSAAERHPGLTRRPG